MNEYIILPHPGYNRTYFKAALQMAIYELQAIANYTGIEVCRIEEKEMSSYSCISFSTKSLLTEKQKKELSTLSMFYVLFECDEGDLMKIVPNDNFHIFPESMNQILKYNGKTNEQFTRLMVNLALSACKTNGEPKKMIDPLCGKGTTLFEGLMRGMDVIGLEINDKWFQETKIFIVKYLQNGKYKHNTKSEKRTAGGKKIADVFYVTTAADKSKYNDGLMQTFQVINTDTRNVSKLIKHRSCDILVTDLPYGVKHGSKSEMGDRLSRSPLDLLDGICGEWHVILKSKGALVFSFNEFTLTYKEAKKVLLDKGFDVLEEEPYINYFHRVDQAINRNLIVAQKP